MDMTGWNTFELHPYCSVERINSRKFNPHDSL